MSSPHGRLIVIDALEGGNSIDMASQQAHKVFGFQIPDSDDAIEGACGDEAAGGVEAGDVAARVWQDLGDVRGVCGPLIGILGCDELTSTLCMLSTY